MRMGAKDFQEYERVLWLCLAGDRGKESVMRCWVVTVQEVVVGRMRGGSVIWWRGVGTVRCMKCRMLCCCCPSRRMCALADRTRRNHRRRTEGLLRRSRESGAFQ
jgi:hypothetical protein